MTLELIRQIREMLDEVEATVDRRFHVIRVALNHIANEERKRTQRKETRK